MLLLVKDVGSYQLLGETLDDAAGEAFDKVGKMLGLAYPAGPEIDRLAKSGNPHFVEFPRGMLNEANYNFSFSGIKTSVLHWLKKNPPSSERAEGWGVVQSDIAASFQRAVVDVLVTKTVRAAEEYEIADIVCAGGVSANSELRERFRTECARRGMHFFVPRPLFSTDNAAMIAMLGALKLERGIVNDLSITARPRMALGSGTD